MNRTQWLASAGPGDAERQSYQAASRNLVLKKPRRLDKRTRRRVALEGTSRRPGGAGGQIN